MIVVGVVDIKAIPAHSVSWFAVRTIAKIVDFVVTSELERLNSKVTTS